MAHEVKFSIPERKLSRADIEFKVAKDGERFGTLKILWLTIANPLAATGDNR